jgi:protein gp37
MALRLKKMGAERYRNGFEVTLHPGVLGMPLTWKKPRTVFVNSMSDLFHEEVPLDFIVSLFGTMQSASMHTFQILTKRSERLASLAPLLPWPPNVWMGVSVESQKYTFRIKHLREVPAAVRFLSLEPLIGPVTDLQLEGIDWVIVGGESGPKCRPVDPAWVRKIREICALHCVPFFFKQWGGKRKAENGRILDGRTWNEMPACYAARRTEPDQSCEGLTKLPIPTQEHIPV